MRDRLLAAGLPLIVLPLLAILAFFLLEPSTTGPGVFLAVLGYSLFVTAPVFPVVVLLSYPVARKGWIGLAPILAIAFLLAGALAGVSWLSTKGEMRPEPLDVLTSMFGFGLIGSVFGLFVWLAMILIRTELYFDLSD